MHRHIKIERAILIAGQHAAPGSVVEVDADTADRLIRHRAAVETDAPAAAAPTDVDQPTPAPKK